MINRNSFIALAITSLLAACGGAGDGDSATDSNPTIGGTDSATIQSKLGVTTEADSAMRVATTRDGRLSGGTVRQGTDPARMTAQVGSLRTPLQGAGTTQTVMDGQVARNTSGGTVFYLPRSGSDMNVGMVNYNSGYNAMVGVFGRETSSAAIGNRAAGGGSANYAGVAEYNRDDGAQIATYRGGIGANANFDNGALTYGSGTMDKISNTAGADTMTLSGNGTMNGSGAITGSFSTQTADGNQVGSTSGSFYGATGQNIGLIFVAPNASGGAILNESR